MNRSKLLPWLCVLGVCAPGLALAESPSDALGLAPPGPCAEPRDVILRADPIYNTAATEAPDEESFSIAGSPSDHFDPLDVAAGPDGNGFNPPAPPEFDRSPCSSPDPGCGILLAAGGGPGPGDGGTIIESPVEPTGPPGTQP